MRPGAALGAKTALANASLAVTTDVGAWTSGAWSASSCAAAGAAVIRIAPKAHKPRMRLHLPARTPARMARAFDRSMTERVVWFHLKVA